MPISRIIRIAAGRHFIALQLAFVLACCLVSVQDMSAEDLPPVNKAEISKYCNSPEPHTAFAIDATKPVRITFPLDIGIDDFGVGSDGRTCLRARQGANEIQQEGQGKALYPIRIGKDSSYYAYYLVRWLNDGAGDVLCNNSWFASFDGAIPQPVTSNAPVFNWHWETGLRTFLKAGVHWLEIQLREDGVFMDSIVLSPKYLTREELDKVETFDFRGFQGQRPSTNPAAPIADWEFSAYPAKSSVIGKGHVNELHLAISCQATNECSFSGSVRVSCASAVFRATGDEKLALGSSESHATRIFGLEFDSSATRRYHIVRLEVLDSDNSVCHLMEFHFKKPFVWAFLGPFARQQRNAGANDDINCLPTKYDQQPYDAARRMPPAKLKVAADSFQDGREHDWKVVEDGSCYDWSGAIDLTKVYGSCNNAFSYAITWLDSQTQLDHRSFLFSADDAAWLWMNGKRVVTLPVDLPREANRLWTSAQLGRGLNPVVIKIAQAHGYWGFRFGIIDWHWQGRRGDLVTGAELSKWPQ